MFTLKSAKQFIEDIRSIDDKIKNIKLRSVEIDKSNSSIKYDFICDTAVDEDLRNKILNEAEKITLPVFTLVQISVSKIVSNDQLVNNAIFKYINENFPSISMFLKPTDVRSVVFGDAVKYTIRLSKDSSEYFVKSGAMRKLNEFLERNFCSSFVGDTDIKEESESINILEEEVFESQLQKIEHRTIKVKEIEIIDDLHLGDTALYIEDTMEGSNTICGTITEIAERETKNNKPFFIIRIDDTTGTMSGVYFSKKNTCGRIRNLKVGDSIIARGTLGEYNGRKSFTFEKINGCKFPENFVKKGKFNKATPTEYKVIIPKKASTITIKSIFDSEDNLSKELTDNVYVVFDLETTGLDVMNEGITEIGAVKIIDGKIAEEFHTLIKPDYPISAKITALTGISEDMVKDSPKISAVLPDFIKFIDGAILVAHNAEFDTKFIKRFASAEEYEIKNKVLDTMVLSRKYLPQLHKNDLHTLAEHFGITFRHHRALSDAYATAEAFIKLMSIKGKLEK